ncbi:glycoside hydrolase family 38 C-terminal domain-containing protein [Marinitoga sp. 1138]|uniref:alpha-mannosidase n=1 Tax=Marinitoga sp. 1138 TaxID=1643334 RepID=UPI00158696CF|nr:glycoside hydrolase family 38 C-terminal domain-containing protein [Marinitoga sp. 1138]
MYHKLNNEIKRINNVIEELLPYQYMKIIEINDWDFTQKDVSKRVNIGYNWDYNHFPVKFKKEIDIPNEYYGEFWFGGETLIKVDGKPYGEINEYHREIALPSGKHLIEAEVVPYNLFGRPSKAIFERANLIKINFEVKKLIRYFTGISQIMQNTDDTALIDELSDLIDKTFGIISIPKETNTYLNSIERMNLNYRQLSNIWSRPRFNKFPGGNLDVSEALKYLELRLKDLRSKYPKIGNIYVTGHAHIDYAWLWPIEETKRKILRTFSNAVLLAEKFDKFTFTQSSAQMYEDIEGSDLFEKIKELVEKGKWDPNGGMWVESDTKIPSIESLIRQFYYAQRFFKERFDKYTSVCWLPDVFGFSWILPQIIKQAKINYFFTTKLTWNEKNPFPYDICYWKGIDGTKVLYHSFYNPKGGYNGYLDAECAIKTFNNFRDRKIFDGTLLTYGYGDGGGGPSEEHMMDFEVTNNLPYVPELIPTTGDKFFRILNESIKDKEIPVWDNELYFEFHRATHFTQLNMKKYHKLLEDELFFAEYILAINNIEYDFSDIWKKLLTREFHDIIPGSSIKEVYDEAVDTLKMEIKNCKDIIDRNLNDSEECVLINYSNYNSDMYFESENEYNLPAQKTYDGRYIYEIESIPSFSNRNLESGEPIIDNYKEDDDLILENEYYLVMVYNDGIEIYDKKKDRNLFEGKGNVLTLYEDIPFAWGAWDIDYNYKKFGEILKAKKISVVESGKLRKVIKLEYEYETTKIIQYISLAKNSKRVDIKTEIDWHLRKKLLKAIFPIDVFSRYARFDISGGYITRPLHKNTTYEQAMFEVYMHRWFDISEPDFGVAILNNGIYSTSIDNNVFGLSLIHGPIYPDLYADEGKHELMYSIMSHSNNIREINEEAEKINKPLRILKKKVELKDKILDFNPLKVVAVFKKDNNLIVRLVEVEGKRGMCKFNIKHMYNNVYLSNILLDEKHLLSENEFEYKPFKIYTLIFE